MTSYGAITCDTFAGTTLDLKTGSGKIAISNATCRDCLANTSYGAVVANHLKGDTIKLQVRQRQPGPHGGRRAESGPLHLLRQRQGPRDHHGQAPGQLRQRQHQHRLHPREPRRSDRRGQELLRQHRLHGPARLLRPRGPAHRLRLDPHGLARHGQRRHHQDQSHRQSRRRKRPAASANRQRLDHAEVGVGVEWA